MARVGVSALLVLIMSLALPSLADAQENAQGAERNCNHLEAADFEAIGDSVMGRMVGSAQGHESMDALMRSMMGQTGGKQMHAALGERYSGCGYGRLPAGSAGMMNGVGGMMGMMGGIGDDRTDYDDDDHFDGGWMIVMMLLLIGGVAAVVYFVARPRRGGSAPAQLLAERFARGEIDAEEYEQRRALLGGSR